MKVGERRVVTAHLAAPAMLLLFGIGWRLIWLVRQHPFESKATEAVNVAIVFARTGRFADAIAPGEGLTAHLNPVMPTLAALVYRLAGVQTPLANWLLSLTALCFSLGSAVMLYRSFGLMGASRTSRLFGLALYCLLPLAPFTELIEFRHWEGGLATFLATSLLYLIVATDVAGATEWPRRLAIALAAAILLFINLPLGFAGYTMCAILLWRKLALRSGIATAVTAVFVLIAVLTPWTIRNYEAFGTFTPLRNNAGLELALANYPAALEAPDQKAAFLSRLREIHPNNNPAVFEKMKKMGGEGQYSAMLRTETETWISSHPLSFSRLILRHFQQFYFPPAWLWYTDSRATSLKMLIYWSSGFLGLLGAIWAINVWRGRFFYAAALALAPALPYILVQPVIRYRFSVLGILLFLSAEIVFRAVRNSIDRIPKRPSAAVSGSD